jgi:hypothetical protein
MPRRASLNEVSEPDALNQTADKELTCDHPYLLYPRNPPKHHRLTR